MTISNNTLLKDSTQLISPCTNLGDALVVDSFTVVNVVLFTKPAEQFLIGISYEIA